jgi:hypothetical protein
MSLNNGANKHQIKRFMRTTLTYSIVGEIYENNIYS